jgi:hypothetical protein
MIETKCTNENCRYAVTFEQRRQHKKRKRKCPLCKSPLKRNVTEQGTRNRWYCLTNIDRSIVECAVLLSIEYYSDDSREFEIPLLDMKYIEFDMLRGIYRATDEIKKFISNQGEVSYNHDQEFITMAYQQETDAIKRNVPYSKLVFVETVKSSLVLDNQSEKSNTELMPKTKKGKSNPQELESQEGQGKLF